MERIGEQCRDKNRIFRLFDAPYSPRTIHPRLRFLSHRRNDPRVMQLDLCIHHVCRYSRVPVPVQEENRNDTLNRVFVDIEERFNRTELTSLRK